MFMLLKQNELITKILLFKKNLVETVEKDNVVSSLCLVLLNYEDEKPNL